MGKTDAEIDRPLIWGRCPATRKMRTFGPSELKAFSRAFDSLSGGRTVEREGGLGKALQRYGIEAGASLVKHVETKV